MKSLNKKPIPYTLAEAEKLCAYHGAPATKCPLEDDRFLATVEERDALNAENKKLKEKLLKLENEVED
jgi:Fe-S oxidoreductase